MKSKRNRPYMAVSAAVRRALRQRALGGLLFLGLALAIPASALAQTAQPAAAGTKLPDKTFMTKSGFYLPVIVDDRVRAQLKEIQLYVKEGPNGTWMLKEHGPGSVTGFNYRLPQDGEYWFSVVTVDQAGHMIPSDVSHEAPGVIIVLDTQAPQVDLHILPSCSDGMCVQCDVQDANPNPIQTHLEYQTQDGIWRSVDALPNQPEAFCIPKQANLTGMVKVTCVDRANNTRTREFSLSALPGANSGVTTAAATQTVDAPVLNPSPAASNVQNVGCNEKHEGADLPKHCPPVGDVNKGTPVHTSEIKIHSGEPAVAEGPAMSSRTTDAPRQIEMTTGNRHILRDPHVTMEYKIEDEGKSGVGKVEVYFTRDNGVTWDVLCDDPDCKTPVHFTLPSEGCYGIRLAVSNGRGFGADPPKPGDVPEFVIELDTTKPTAQLQSVKLGPPQERDACIDITWTADDKNFGATPIDLYYSETANGPWTAIAKGLHNDGKYRWYLPKVTGKQAYVRLVATDLAGNSTRCDCTEAVALDDNSRPSVQIIGIVPDGH